MFSKPETWVLVAFILFVALMVYLKVPKMITDMLDGRAAKISADLAEAKKLREEAQALLAEYKKKRADAEGEAAEIIAAAKSDAREYAAETSRKLEETLTRRQAQAEQKIAQAEISAIKEVRSAAADLAIAAATLVLAETSKGQAGASLIGESIEAVRSRLN